MGVFLPSPVDGSCGLTRPLSGKRRLPVPATFSPEWAVTWLLEKSREVCCSVVWASLLMSL